MKKTYFLLTLILSICLIFTSVSAFDSSWDHYSGKKSDQDPAEVSLTEFTEGKTDIETEPASAPVRETISQGLRKSEPVPAAPAVTEPSPDVNAKSNNDSGTSGPSADLLTEGTFTLDTLRIAGMEDESSRQVLDMLEKLKVSYFNQTGDAPRSGFTLSIADQDILTYALQKTDPYYVSSNILGSETYMITDADQFEEKLVTAFYDLLTKMSSDTSGIPPLEDILPYISAIREKNLPGMQIDTTAIQEDMDVSALMPRLFSIISNFTIAEPEQAIDYLYTDLSSADPVYTWPERSELPDPLQASSSMAFTVTGDDIIALLDVLPQFFEDNPELKAMMNQYLEFSMKNSADIRDGDYVEAWLTELQNSPKDDLKTLTINILADQADSGAPARTRIDIAQTKEEVRNGMTFFITIGEDEKSNVIDIAGDMFSGEETLPFFRGLMVFSSGRMSVNFRMAAPDGTEFEYAQNTDSYDKERGVRVTDTGIQYCTGSNRGTISILNTANENEIGGQDSVTKISWNHESSGQRVFTAGATLTGNDSKLLPALTPADAVHASDMTDADYNSAAQNILMQFMMLMMNFS